MRRKKILIQHFAEAAASPTAAIKILCVMLDLQDEPDTFTVYQGEVQTIPQTLLSRKVDCWEVSGDTLHIFVWDTELTEIERWKLLHED
ncbi:hypothetical protein [Allofournierella massiliensis]|uniref:hypothetical protein n=1 Tax=Allofournierella massiliensis TaxID=1650663 RepID=UPI00073F8AA4|nr:hypothetical protein [Fournierella massiliensis]